MAKIDDFFTLTNRVEGVDDERYRHLAPMMSAIDAMANATYQSIYVIDYFKQGFLHVASNPLFLCGHTAEEVRQMGYRFYIDHVPAEEQVMLTEINEVGFKRFNKTPLDDRNSCFMSYDFHIVNDGNRYLVNHKITPFALNDNGRAWLALCVVSLSAQGYTVPQIADKMCRALDTVKTYKRAMFERLGVRSITEALTVATNQGLL